jgi:hypothetical protein
LVANVSICIGVAEKSKEPGKGGMAEGNVVVSERSIFTTISLLFPLFVVVLFFLQHVNEIAMIKQSAVNERSLFIIY